MQNPLTPFEANFIIAVVLVFGAMIGSFLNVVIFRLPAEKSIVWPGSHCPKCQHALGAAENIPVLSWLMLGAKCRWCKAPISWRYPAIEIVTALLFLAVYLAFGYSFQTLCLWVLVGLMVVTFWIDIDTMLIYDQITIPGIVLGLLYSYFVTDQLWLSLAACLYAVAFLIGVNALSLLIIGEDGVGGGDMTLVAMLGAWLGLQPTILAVGLSMVFGSILGLGVLFIRWAREGHWRPIGIALATTPVAYVGACALTAGPFAGQTPGWWYGAGFEPWLAGALVGVAAFLGACAGWVYMRTVKDEGRLLLPFGPALVLGGLSALFFSQPMISWYMARLGSH